MAPTGQLAQQALAGGYESVRHMLNSIEGEETEVADLEFDDEDNQNKPDKNNTAEDEQNNLETEHETEHENDNVSDEVKFSDSDKASNSANHEDICATENQDTHEMIIDKLYKQLFSED